jgi:pyruvate dehydrogenase E2 component (dihydrolipoamide acetyltransferase)
MPINILMPALSPTMEKGNLAKWLKKEGDAVKSGDVIAEIETDKATMEVEAVDEGVLAKIVVPEGTADVPVNQLIALIAGEGEDPKAVTGDGAPAAGSPAPAPVKVESAPAPSAPPKEPAPAASPTPPQANAAPGPGPEGQLSYARVNAAPQGPATEVKAAGPAPGANGAAPAGQVPAGQVAANGAAASGGRVFASPLARRVAKEAGLDIAAIKGSGPHGRVIERDVREAMAAPRQAPAPQPAAAPAPAPTAAPAPKQATPAPTGMSDEQIRKFFEPGSFEEIPHDGMRKTIARRLTESKQTIPHFYLTVDVELDALLALREQINGAAGKTRTASRPTRSRQRLRHQGAGAGADARAGRQRVLDRRGDAEAPPRRCRRRGVDPRRADHPGGTQGRDQDAVRHLQRDERFRRPRPSAKAEARGVPGRLDRGVEPRHVRRQGLCCRDQPAARDDSGRRRGREAGGGEGRRSLR